MDLNYCMDIGTKSFSVNHTPGLAAQKLPFYAYSCGHYYANPSYYTERSGLQNNYLLLYTLSGRGFLQYNQNKYQLEPNSAVIFNCYDYQLYKTASEEPWEFKWLHFSGATANEYYNIVNEGSPGLVRPGEQSDINGLMDDICECILKNDRMVDIKICGDIVNIFTEIILSNNNPEKNMKYTQYRDDIEKAIDFIKADFKNKITLDDITGRMHVSKYHFLRIFKSYTGFSLHEYLNNYRISVSKNLLKNTNQSISEIALLTGFQDPNSFIRYFKRVTGTTPASFRKYWI